MSNTTPLGSSMTPRVPINVKSVCPVVPTALQFAKPGVAFLGSCRGRQIFSIIVVRGAADFQGCKIAADKIISISTRGVRSAGEVSTEYGHIEQGRDQETPQEAGTAQEEAAVPFLSGRLQSFAPADLRGLQGLKDLAADDRPGGAHSVSSPDRELRQVSARGSAGRFAGAVHGIAPVRAGRIDRSAADRASGSRPRARTHSFGRQLAMNIGRAATWRQKSASAIVPPATAESSFDRQVISDLRVEE